MKPIRFLIHYSLPLFPRTPRTASKTKEASQEQQRDLENVLLVLEGHKDDT